MPDGSSNANRTAKKLSAIAATNTRARQEAILTKAYAKAMGLPEANDRCELNAEAAYKIIHAAVFAVIPGKQNHRNAGKLVNAAVLAGARVIRRSR